MGLAPYGNPARYRAFWDSRVQLRPNGCVRIPALGLNHTRDEREIYEVTRKYLDDELIERRAPDGEVTDRHCDIAAALQECLEQTIIHVCRHFGETTGLRRLSLA